jgi:hypothetical protein
MGTWPDYMKFEGRVTPQCQNKSPQSCSAGYERRLQRTSIAYAEWRGWAIEGSPCTSALSPATSQQSWWPGASRKSNGFQCAKSKHSRSIPKRPGVLVTRAPGSDVWVLFDDLPKAARDRLSARIESRGTVGAGRSQQ